MKNTKRVILYFIMSFILTLGGCNKPPVEVPEEEIIPPDYNHITWQTDRVSTTSAKRLEDNRFYIEHTNEDGSVVYYNLGSYTMKDNQIYYQSNENFPTLFVQQGDRIVYHSYDNILTNIYFSRFQDLGYTIGIYDIGTIENGRCILAADSSHVLPLCNDADFFELLEAETILIDELGETLPTGYTYFDIATTAPETLTGKTFTIKGNELQFYEDGLLIETRNCSDYDMSSFDPKSPKLEDITYPKLTSETVRSGILYGLKKDSNYYLEYYAGTYFGSATMKANIHVYSIKEYYHTHDYNVLEGTLFEIELPKEMKNGLYTVGLGINGGGTFRLVTGEDYAIYDDFFSDYTFPENIVGMYSEVDRYNILQPASSLENATKASVIPAGTNNLYFSYVAGEDTSFLYKKDGAVIKNIQIKYKDLIESLPEADLITIYEVGEMPIINLYYENAKSVPSTLKNFSIEGASVNILENVDILFLRGGKIFFSPVSGTDGIMVANATVTKFENINGAPNPDITLEMFESGGGIH